MTKNKLVKLKTWAGRSNFEYEGCVSNGLKIYYGNKKNILIISATKMQKLLVAFHNKEVEIGTSRTSPPEKSLGSWMQGNISKTGIASYIGPILIAERYAKKTSKTRILFT